MKKPVDYIVRKHSVLVGFKRDLWFREPIYEEKEYSVPIYRFDWRWRDWQSLGAYRAGTSYRRNPDHLPKAPQDNTWRRSRKDWRHGEGWRGCSGCPACVRWEVYNRGAERARNRDELRRTQRESDPCFDDAG